MTLSREEAQAIVNLRRRTAERSRDGHEEPVHGIADCRQALQACGWDEEKAVHWLMVRRPRMVGITS